MEVCIPVLETIRADVAVIGGGTAGCFAALAAARAGANTVLVEKSGILGGTMTLCGVDFPGLFHAWGKQIIAGLGWESIERAKSLGGATFPSFAYDRETYRPSQHWKQQVRLDRTIYAKVLDVMCEEACIRTMLHTMFIHASQTDDGVEILLGCKEGVRRVLARCAVDATGDANLVAKLGYAVESSDRLQPATLQNKLSGYDPETVDYEALKDFVKEAIARDILPPGITEKKIVHWVKIQKIDNHIPCPHDAWESAGKSRVEAEARRHLVLTVQALREFPGLRSLFIQSAASECGIHETNRIVGEYTVTADDYVSGKRFDDAICYAFYPIDLHVQSGIDQVFLKEGVVPTIPYRALIPKGSRHVLAAGRILSSDTMANSALRVQAPCMATGQAAGCAAAIAAKLSCSVQEVTHERLCTELEAQGVILP